MIQTGAGSCTYELLRRCKADTWFFRKPGRRFVPSPESGIGSCMVKCWPGRPSIMYVVPRRYKTIHGETRFEIGRLPCPGWHKNMVSNV